MKLRDEARWQECVEANQDPYGGAVVKFAEKWADAMEAKLSDDVTVADIAKDACSEAGKEFGITGFMYGCAVNILAHVWEHGEELRKWHNLDTQLGDEGERANEEGGVLNPAVLSVAADKL